MNTCTMTEIYHCDELSELLGCFIKDWNGEDEIENWDGGIVLVDDNGIIYASYNY